LWPLSASSPTTFEPSDSLLDDRGRLRHFGRPPFKKLAADLDRCFVCGTARNFVDFNDEHVIPDWILRRLSLHSRQITLPNGQNQLYAIRFSSDHSVQSKG